MTLYENKGADLEFQTAAYFQAHGYVVRRGVTLSIAAGTAEATDVDLIALRFGLPLIEERLIADCKDRKKPRPYERILWTHGLASYANANRSIVVAPRVPWQAREFAAYRNVEILGVDSLEAYLSSIDTSLRPFGDADYMLAQSVRTVKQQMSPQDKDLERHDLAVKQALIAGHPLTNLNRIISILSLLQKSHHKMGAGGWLKYYVMLNAGVVATVMLLRFAAECKWTPETEWMDYARKKLTYGDVSPQKAKQLAKLALKQDFYDGLPTPKYTDELLEVIKTLIAKAGSATVTPYVLDHYLFAQILGRLSNKTVVTLLGDQYDEAFKAGKRVLSALSYAAEMSAQIWEQGPPSLGHQPARVQKEGKRSVEEQLFTDGSFTKDKGTSNIVKEEMLVPKKEQSEG